MWCQLGAVAACFLFKYLLQVTQLACARYRSERNKTLACTDVGAEPGSKERSSPAVEPQASAHAQQHPKQQQQLAPRSSAHCDIRAAAVQEVTGRSGHGGGGSGARARFGAVALKAAADARTKAQHVAADPQPGRCAACLSPDPMDATLCSSHDATGTGTVGDTGTCHPSGARLSHVWRGRSLCYDQLLCRVKCFYAGVRWGLTLAPETLSSRQLLATALSTAFSVVSSLCIPSCCCSSPHEHGWMPVKGALLAHAVE